METVFTDITDYLLRQSWQIAILFAVVAIVCLAIRKKTAHLRYLLWLLIIAKCLVPSLITVSLAILPQKPLPQPLPESAPIREFAPPPETVILSEAKMPAPLAVPRPSIMAQLAQIRPKTWFSGIWLCGVGLFLIIVLVKAARFNHRLKGQRKRLTAGMQKEIDELLVRFGIHTKLRIWLLEGIGQPFVWGLLRGAIYLPANFGRIGSREHRRGILMHEIAHTVRFDATVNILQTIAQAIFWFHPLVWWANRNIRAEREKCCDETTIARLSASPKVYSSAIVDTLIAEYQSTQPVPSLAIAGPIKNIEDRIKTIMKPGKKFYNRPTIIAIVTILLLAIAAVPTTIALTHRQATKPEEFLAKDTEKVSSEFIKTLPNGVTVELVGVCEHPSKAKRWWRPDGRFLSEVAGHDLPGRVPLKPGKQAKEIAISFKNTYRKGVRTFFEFEEGSNSTYRNEHENDKGYDELIRGVAFLTDEGRELIDIRAGAAAGQWETVSSRSSNKIGRFINGMINRDIKWDEPVEINGKTVIFARSNDVKRDIRIVAIDINDKLITPILPTSYFFRGEERLETKVEFDISLSDIKEFQFQARTIEWVTFKNVSLKPNFKPDVQVEDEVRIIHFPKNRSMGTLSIGRRDPMDSVWWGKFTKHGPAKGDVKVPVGQDVWLMVDKEACKDITPLVDLEPDDIQAISFYVKSGGNSIEDGDLENLSGLTGLKQLGLGSSKIKGQGLKHLSKLEALEVLTLSRTNLTDDAVKYIAKFKSLQRLALDDTLVTDTGISYLNESKSLEVLTLYRTDITGEGFSNFSKDSSLREVLLNFSGITDDGLAHIASLQSLERLSLFHTGISDKGLVHLKDFKSLRRLNLEHTEVTDEGMEYLADLTSLEELGLPDGVTDKGLAKLNKLTGLKWLDISYVQLTGKGLKVLENFKKLEFLDFPAGVVDDDLGVLKELTSLKQLWIQNSPITNKGLTNLKHLGSLKELLLYNGDIEVKMEVTCSALYNVSPGLTYLNMNDIQLDETRLNSLSRFTQLEKLEIDGMPLRDDDLANLANLRKLKTLFLSSDTVSDGGIAHLANLTSMEDLAPSVSMTDKGLKHFSRMKKLDRLQLNGDFTDEGFKYLEQLKSLSTLRIATANEISLESRERIKKALPFLRTLHVIKKTGVNPRPQPGQTAPAFVCKSLDGKKWQLSDYRGKVVLLHFWATWCSPCVASTPALKQFHKELGRYKDFAMISFSLDDDDFGFRQHVRRNGLSWPQVRLGHQSQIGKDYGVSGVPAYILVDPDGKILISRGFDWNKIEEAVAKELGNHDIIEVPKQKPDVQVEVQNSLATEAAESTENNQKTDVQVEDEDSSINVADKTDEPLDARSQKALKTVREFISALKAEKYEIANTYLLSESEQADEWPELDAIKDLPLLNNIKDFKNVTIPDRQLTVVMGDWESGVLEAFLVSSDFISNDGETGKLFFILADMAVFRPDTYESEHWGIRDIALTKFKLQMPPDLQKESDKLVSKIQQLIPYINSYAKDHEGDLPDELNLLEDYGLDGYELFGGPVWWHKVPYRGKGKNRNLADPSRIIIAEGFVYKRCEFYHWPILFLDGHIETRSITMKDLEVGLKEIPKKRVWSEGKAMMGTIATGIRAWVAENYIEGAWDNESLTLSDLGFMPGDLRGTYFDEKNFYWDVSFRPAKNDLKFTILAIAPKDTTRPAAVMLDQSGKWTTHETLPMKNRLGYVKKMKAFAESAEKLKELGLALYMYERDHEDKLPDSLEELKPYDTNGELAWARQNVEYLGKGKSAATDPATLVIAYDRTLFEKKEGTNVLFNDHHVQFYTPQRLKDLGIPPDWKEKAQIAIESRFILFPEDSQELRDFLEAEGIELPAGEWQDNSITAPAGSEEIEKFLEEKGLLGTQTPGPPAPILDPDQVEKLIRLTQVSAKSRMVTSPKLAVLDGESAVLSIMQQEMYISGYAESDSASEPEPITKTIDKGLTFEVLPKITDDEKNIKLDLDIELTTILGYVEDVYKGQYPYKLPEIEKTKIVARVTIPDGKTVLMAGKIISSTILDRDDDSGADKTAKELLILITPTIEPERD